jgi:hypothetical protein
MLWRRLYKHNEWKKVKEDVSEQFYNLNVLKPVFIHWKSQKADWKLVYKQRHYYPVVYWGMELLRKSLLNWKKNVDMKKLFDGRCGRAIKWRNENLFKNGILRIFKVGYWLLTL